MNYGDRQVVVTGGTGALGIAVVEALMADGATCVVPWRDAKEAERVPFRDSKLVKLVGPVELSDEDAVAKLYAGVPSLWASIHIAGGFAFGPVAKSKKADLARLIDINLVSAVLCSAAAVNAIAATGQGGRIVNVAARPALEWRSGAGMAAYTATKAAVAAFTAALAEEVVKENILVNAVAPSIMDTPANRASMPDAKYDKWPKVSEVAATIVFLASPENKVTRGAIVPVYGKV